MAEAREALREAWRGPLLQIIAKRSSGERLGGEVKAEKDSGDSGNGSSPPPSPALHSPPPPSPQPAKRPRANSNSFLVANLLSLADASPPMPAQVHPEPPAMPSLPTSQPPPLPHSAYSLPFDHKPPLQTFTHAPKPVQPFLPTASLPSSMPSFQFPATSLPSAFLHSAHSSPFTAAMSSASQVESRPGPVGPSPLTESQVAGPNGLSGSLCLVCEDKASGFHYSVLSCEGCKGFFRRSVQKNMEYSCPKEAQCPVNRITRNRCQACRFQKCLRVGMSRESVRQDGNRKRRQKDVEEEEELKTSASLHRLVRSLAEAHSQAFPPPPSAVQTGLEPVARFAAAIPGFGQLCPSDQLLLLHSARLELLLLHASFYGLPSPVPPMPDENNNDEAAEVVGRLRSGFAHLQVMGEELGLLSALCLLPSSQPSLREPAAVEALQGPILQALRVQIALRRPKDPNAAAKLLLRISDLRALSQRSQALPTLSLSNPSGHRQS